MIHEPPILSPTCNDPFVVASWSMRSTLHESSVGVPYHVMEHDLLPFLCVQHRYPIIIIGDTGVGKTTFVRQHKDANIKSYSPSVALEVHQLGFETTMGYVECLVRDTVGQERWGGLRDGMYIGCEGAILMYDVSSRMTYKNIPSWYREVTRVCEGIPVVLCGNKVDIVDRKVKPKHVTFHRKKNLMYVEVSASGQYNCHRPYLELIRKFLNDRKLEFTQSIHDIARNPPTVTIPPSLIDEIESNLQQMHVLVLPEDEDTL
eukprot:PhF_6_TR13168/c0_g1_i2/m.20767/K07936/RAN; GTP-binding nuclear protein Ran